MRTGLEKLFSRRRKLLSLNWFSSGNQSKIPEALAMEVGSKRYLFDLSLGIQGDPVPLVLGPGELC